MGLGRRRRSDREYGAQNQCGAGVPSQPQMLTLPAVTDGAFRSDGS